MRIALLLLSTAALAQTANPITAALKSRYDAAKLNIVEAAAAMPEEHYAFKLTPPQRTYGDWVGHTAMLMESACGQMQGKSQPPMDHSAHAATASKDEIQKMLAGAVSQCDAAFAAMDDAKLTEPVGARKVMPINPALGLLGTLNSHYGNMVGYLRTKGITPPSTARTQKK